MSFASARGRILMDAALAEMRRQSDYILPLHLDLAGISAVVSCLQLALRHPAMGDSPSACNVRMVVDGIIARLEEDGLKATAVLLRLGDDPAYDDPHGGVEAP